mgnify:CR=1 FL=1
MERISVDDVDTRIGPAAVKRVLGPALETTEVALNYYELAPGDSFGFGYHRHSDQEEVFYVLQGTATFETEDEPVAVGPDEAIRFGREEFQRGWNRGDERVRALALGAPLEYGDQPKLRHCPDCDEQTDTRLERTEDGTAVVAHCRACGAETGQWYEGSMDGDVL